jgi:peptidoglycan/LPS O-acetylase OafA/YrhL
MAVIYVCIALRSITIQKIFSNSIIVWLGRISFPMYLLHILVIASISSYFYISVDFFRGDIGLLLLLLITLTITFVISHLFTVFIDEPLMKTFDKVYSKSIELVKHITLFK